MENFNIDQAVERIVGSAIGSIISSWLNRRHQDHRECPECARRRRMEAQPPMAA